MKCPDCQRGIPSESNFCLYCGQPLLRCEPCGLCFGEESAFCGRCGERLPVESDPIFRAPEPMADGVRGYIYEVDDPSTHHSLESGDNTVGAGGHNDIVVNDPTISWNHALVLCRENEILVQDSASTNGTKVNGESVLKPRLVDHDTTVEFGSCSFRFWLPESSRTTGD